LSDKHDDATADLLIKEVDEDLRHEQLEQMWKKYGSLLVTAAVALVLGVAGWQAWRAWDTKQRQASSLHYYEATQLADNGRRDQALAALAKLSADGTKGYRLLADMKRAALEEDNGDLAGAAAIYHSVATAGGVDQAYRDLALLKASYLDLDTADPAAVEKAIAPLAEEASPWRYSAREVMALAALKRGDTAAAAESFRKLADDIAAPQGVRARAAEMLATLPPKAKS
jgi:hypothetical protein